MSHCCLLTAASFLLATASVAQTNPPEPAGRPNIIFVLADDLGWSEPGCYGNTFNETPHLDQLAAQGMRFTQAYAAAPVCSPYRAAFLTGQHPARVGIVDYLRPNSANALSTDHVTLPELLQQAGYATGMIGKWHLSGYKSHDAEHEITPLDHGFDWNIARERKGVSNGVNFWPYEDRRTKTRWLDLPTNRLGEDEFLVDRMNLEAVNFVERNKDQPFFLFLSHYAPHSIVHGKPQLVQKYQTKHAPGKSSKTRCVICSSQGLKGCPQHHWATSHNPHLAAMLESIDDGIGLLTTKLKELGLADNTIIIFTSDNGGETNVTSNAPLRGGKSQLYEGGIRVPLIVRWPQQVPAGTVCQQPTTNMDFYPTLLQATGIQPDPTQTLDGISTLTTWQNPAHATKRDAFYWHYPLDRPHFLGGISGGAIRAGDWKLVEPFDRRGPELYSLADDPSEQTNLADRHPDRVAALQRQLNQWRDDVAARRPSPPLLTEAGQLYFADHFSSGLASSRWHFNEDWIAEKGVLTRAEQGAANTRIFIKKPEFQDVVVRFDFQMQQSQDLRLMTGSDGHYNAVIHVRPDHFYVQTAKDEPGPYFSFRHGECAYRFEPNRWYTMTVEFIGDQLVAHVDGDHVAYAQHPMLKKQRDYFAIQVDEHPAAFDNIQIFRARKHRQQAGNLTHVRAVTNKYPVKKSAADEFEIQKRNAHEWLYQRDEKYRNFILKLDELDAQKKQQFPEVFGTTKEARKRIQAMRKKLNMEDAGYKKLLHATHRANRAIDAWLFAQQPGSVDLPESRRKRTLAVLRKQHGHATEYLQLLRASQSAQQKLEQAYPELFVDDETIKQQRNNRRDAVKDSASFKQLNKDRAALYRASQEYLIATYPGLSQLRQKLDSTR